MVGAPIHFNRRSNTMKLVVDMRWVTPLVWVAYMEIDNVSGYLCTYYRDERVAFEPVEFNPKSQYSKKILVSAVLAIAKDKALGKVINHIINN